MVSVWAQRAEQAEAAVQQPGSGSPCTGPRTLPASDTPGVGGFSVPAETTARELVLTSADAAWAHRVEVDGLPRFGAHCAQPTGREGDLSVQLPGWMLLEAAASLDR